MEISIKAAKTNTLNTSLKPLFITYLNINYFINLSDFGKGAMFLN